MLSPDTSLVLERHLGHAQEGAWGTHSDEPGFGARILLTRKRFGARILVTRKGFGTRTVLGRGSGHARGDEGVRGTRAGEPRL